MGVLFIVETHFKGLLEHCDHVGPVGCGHEVKRTANLLNKFVATRSCFFIHVYFVGNNHAGNVGALGSHFLVPVLQVLIRHLAVCIEH